MPKLPSISSNKLVKLLNKGGAVFVRQGKTDHAIYSRMVQGNRYSAIDIRHQFKWERRHWIQFTVSVFLDS